jgi:hypothetical protein
MDKQHLGSLNDTSTTAGALVLLSTLTASASAQLDFTAFDGATYGDYEFHISGLYPATDAVELNVRFSLDGGSTYRSTAADYIYTLTAAVQGSAVSLGSVGDTEITITSVGATSGLENTVGKSLNGKLVLAAPADGNNVMLHGNLAYTRTGDDGVFTAAVGGRFIGTTGAVNGIRFFMSSGNITGGIIRVYGVKK